MNGAISDQTVSPSQRLILSAKKLIGKLDTFLRNDTFSLFSHRCLIAYCCSAALSIGLAQILTVAIIFYWICWMSRGYAHDNDANSMCRLKTSGSSCSRFIPAVFAWLLACYVSVLTGLEPAVALREALKTSFYVLLPFALLGSLTAIPLSLERRCARIGSYCVAMLLGQGLAALHTVLSEAVGHELKPHTPGPVTEAGQLVLLLPFFAGWILSQRNSPSTEAAGYKSRATPASSLLLFLSFVLLAWPQLIAHNEAHRLLIQFTAGLLAASLMLSYIAAWLYPGRKFGPVSFVQWTRNNDFFHLAGVLLLVSLLLNLKRGPWLGVFLAMISLGALVSRRLLIGTLLVCALFLLAFQPVKSRIANLGEHFSISGGRQIMWSLGLELAERFPLGVGSHNSRFMQQLDPSLPRLHRHMHNNLLTVTAETGWFGLAAYVWWMYVAIEMGFSVWKRLKDSPLGPVEKCEFAVKGDGPPQKEEGIFRQSPLAAKQQTAVLALSLGTGLLGWQVAGLVEYNYGDAEIRLMAFFFMGLLLALSERTN